MRLSAQSSIRPVRTPLLIHGTNLRLKAENFQSGGSYKIRGVHAYLSHQATVPAHLATVSAGNLGRAVAEAAQRLAIPCTVYVPSSAPAAKKERIRATGANLQEKPFAEIFRLVAEPPESAQGASFLHPLLTPELTFGYGEIAHEILADLPDCDAIVAPFGLGGLTLGIARGLRATSAPTRVIAAELDLCAPYTAALIAGRPVAVPKTESFVDAIGTPFVLPYVFEEARALLPEAEVVTLAETRAALRELLLFHGMRVEGAAAVAFAAAKRLARRHPTLRFAAVLSGGNIDRSVFLDIVGA